MINLDNLTLPPGKSDFVEIEARFGSFSSTGFSSSVDLALFNLLLRQYQNDATVTRFRDESMNLTTKAIRARIRKRTWLDGPTKDEVEWTKKTPYSLVDKKDYGVRVSVSTEEPHNPDNKSVGKFVPDRVKERTRYSIEFPEEIQTKAGKTKTVAAYQLDLTVTPDQDKAGRPIFLYEVELELKLHQFLSNFPDMIESIYVSLYDTDLIYSLKERNQVFLEINQILNPTEKRQIDHQISKKFLAQTRNLNFQDCVYGGLVGNPTTAYTVTQKADGDRKQLIFATTGVYLFYPPVYLNKIHLPNLTEWDKLAGTIIEGELIPPASRKKGAPKDELKWYMVYDLLARNGSVGIQSRPHRERRAKLADLIGSLGHHFPAVAFSLKEFFDLEIPTVPSLVDQKMDHFFAVMSQVLAEQAAGLTYLTDGLIFTPDQAPYNPLSDRLPLRQRVLTDYPDICKWKTAEQTTIDFQIRRSKSGRIKLLSGQKPQKKGDGTAPRGVSGEDTVEFAGSTFWPVDGAIDQNSPITQGVEDGTIVEYRYDFDTKLLTPEKVRINKTKPNTLDIATANWDWLHDPITAAMLQGQGLRFAVKYHSRVKSQLHAKIAASKTGLTLLDIGSGKGGDVNKWKNYDRVIAVEPGTENLDELHSRIEAAGLEDRVRVVAAKGQDTTLIQQAVLDYLGEPVDVVSLMLSLSFFWENRDALLRLTQTISACLKPGGRIIFLTIDGPAVEELFAPHLLSYDDDQAVKIKLNGAQLIRSFPEDAAVGRPQLEVVIPGTKMVAERQTEWLVYIEDLLAFFRDARLEIYQRTDTELFLSRPEQVYCRLYAWGVITLSRDLGGTDQLAAWRQGTDIMAIPTLQAARRVKLGAFPAGTIKATAIRRTGTPPKQAKRADRPDVSPSRRRIAAPARPSVVSDSETEDDTPVRPQKPRKPTKK